MVCELAPGCVTRRGTTVPRTRCRLAIVVPAIVAALAYGVSVPNANRLIASAQMASLWYAAAVSLPTPRLLERFDGILATLRLATGATRTTLRIDLPQRGLHV